MPHNSTNMLKKFKRLYIDIYYYFFPISRLRKSGAKIGKNVFIGKSVYFELENARFIEIEDDVVISACCKFIPHDSSLNNVLGEKILYGKIILRKNSYIGVNTTLLLNTEVGERTIIGANSLVKGTYKKDSVYVGSPAKYYCSIKELQKRWNEKY